MPRALKQKLGGLTDQLVAIPQAAVAEGRAMTAEEQSKFDALKAEVTALEATIRAAEEAQNRTTSLEQLENALPRPLADPGHVAKDELDDGGFKNLGELLNAVRFGDPRGRLQNLSTGDAGILIPPRFAQEIMRLDGEQEIVMPRATEIPAGDPPDAPFMIPYLRQGADGALGGVALSWTAEAQPKPNVNEPQLDDLTLTPQECSGLATVNNKTLINWQASGAFMTNLMRMAWVNGRDIKFLNGSGVGCPLGLRRSKGAIWVNRNTSGSFVYADALAMLAALYAGPGEPVWIINQTLMPVIMSMTDPAGHYIFNAGDATKGVPATLLGIRILWNGKTPTLGQAGDVTLAKLNYYLVKPGSGPFVAISGHSRFSNNQTQFRIVANVDGQLWVKEPLTLEDGVTRVSPVVLLKA